MKTPKVKLEVSKENLKDGDLLELKGFRSEDIGTVHQEKEGMIAAFESGKVLSLVCWDNDLKYVSGDTDYDVVAIKRLTSMEKRFIHPQNLYCASNIADRYEELGLKNEWMKRRVGKKV